MNYILIFILMLFCHYLADYPMQGILASMKQKSWWKQQQNYNDKYKYDYIAALFIHSFVWAFMISLPILIKNHLETNFMYLFWLILNTLIHCIIDNCKANLNLINLITDQILHLIQIILTFLTFI